MNQKRASIKHQDIEKINTRMVVAVAVASFVIIFSIIASRVLLNELFYQNRVADAKQVALQQLKSDVAAANKIINSYKTFVSQPTNLIGGNSTANGQNDGDNAQIVLDSLPSQYDFPALITSLNKIIASSGVTLSSLGGTDTSLEQTQSALSSKTSPIPIAFQFSVVGTSQSIQSLISEFQHSIRPFQFLTMDVSAQEQELSLNVTAQTYYQPGIEFQIGKETVK